MRVFVLNTSSESLYVQSSSRISIRIRIIFLPSYIFPSSRRERVFLLDPLLFSLFFYDFIRTSGYAITRIVTLRKLFVCGGGILRLVVISASETRFLLLVAKCKNTRALKLPSGVLYAHNNLPRCIR